MPHANKEIDMKKKSIFTLLIILISSSIFSQTNIPIIRATSEVAYTRESKNLISKPWYISPNLRPDIYKTSSKHAKVKFYTDIDSITFKIEPGKTCNFIILLNDRDSAFTQIKYETTKSLPSHLTVLKQGYKYDLTDNRPILKFTYQSEKSPELLQMRQVFNLDSIAGAGDELSKILNLLHWVHNSYRFDGSKELPPYDGIVDLMTKCYQSNYTMYCGALASVLNECYLAIGLKSRQVVC